VLKVRRPGGANSQAHARLSRAVLREVLPVLRAGGQWLTPAIRPVIERGKGGRPGKTRTGTRGGAWRGPHGGLTLDKCTLTKARRGEMLQNSVESGVYDN
jgi:hypothetical protein